MDEQTLPLVQVVVGEAVRPLREEVYRMLPEITMLKEGIGILQNAVENTGSVIAVLFVANHPIITALKSSR